MLAVTTCSNVKKHIDSPGKNLAYFLTPINLHLSRDVFKLEIKPLNLSSSKSSFPKLDFELENLEF